MKPKAPALPIDLAAAPEPVSENLRNQGFDIFTAKYIAHRIAALKAGQGLYEWEFGLAVSLVQGALEDALPWEQKVLSNEAERAVQIEKLFREDWSRQKAWPLAWRQTNGQPEGRDLVRLAEKLLCEMLTEMENQCRGRADDAQNRGIGSLTEREVKQYVAALTIFEILTAAGRTFEYAKLFVEEDAGVPLNWDNMRRERRRWRKENDALRDKGLRLTEAGLLVERYEEIILLAYKDCPTEEKLHNLLNIFKS
jgi:hypothetical protein